MENLYKTDHKNKLLFLVFDRQQLKNCITPRNFEKHTLMMY